MDEVLVSHKWTRNEIADCIKDCGCIPDNETIDSLAEKLRARLKSVLDGLASEIDMVPADEPAASLYKLGVELPSCNNCGHYDGVKCDYYQVEKRRRDWADTVNCEQYLSPHPWGTERRSLRYTNSETGRYAEFQYEIIALGFPEKFPEAHFVVEALRKNPEWSNRLDDVWKKVDEKESPEKWELIESLLSETGSTIDANDAEDIVYVNGPAATTCCHHSDTGHEETDIKLPEDIMETFPDWKELQPGNWSEYGKFLTYEDGCKVEVGLYREPMDGGEYAGTYTLQIYNCNDVIFCSKIEEVRK